MHRLYRDLERREFTINIQSCDVKTACIVETVDFLVGFENSLDSSVRQMVHRSETNLSTVRQKEWYLVDKGYVGCQCDVPMEFEDAVRHLNKIRCPMSWFSTCGFSFQGCYVFAPNFMGCDDVLYRHRAVLDLVTLNDPFEILCGRVSKGRVQGSCQLCTFQLTFAEFFSCFLQLC